MWRTPPVRLRVVPFLIAMVCARAMGDTESLAISSSITDTGSSQAKPSCAILLIALGAVGETQLER